jgi:hypothetical protein
MDPAMFCRLTHDRHWSPDRFQRWFTDCTLRLLLPGDHHQATANRSNNRSRPHSTDTKGAVP